MLYCYCAAELQVYICWVRRMPSIRPISVVAMHSCVDAVVHLLHLSCHHKQTAQWRSQDLVCRVTKQY